MDYDLKGKVAIVTGSSRGIGRAIAHELSKKGCNLILTARSEESLKETERICNENNIKIFKVIDDLTDKSTPQKIIDICKKEFGRLDVLINNAGSYYNSNLIDADMDSIENMLELNVNSVFRLTKESLPLLQKQERSSVIIISSISGKMSFGGGSGYCASKHAIMGFAGSLFEEVREKGVKVCSICPGFVNTDMIDGRGLNPEKTIQPEDIAKTALFVATFPNNACPTEIVIRPQFSPYK